MYLNREDYLVLENKMKFQISRKHYFHECLNTILNMKLCKEQKNSVLCHFLQSNNFAFDSMLYDGETETLVLIKITIDRNHDIHYDIIKNMIKGESEQPTLNENNEAYFSKYITFFTELRKSDFVRKYVFLWMTPSRYQELEDKSYQAKKDLELNSNFIEIFPYHSGLIREIEILEQIGKYL